MLLGASPFAMAVRGARVVAAAVANMLLNPGFASAANWTLTNTSGSSSIAGGKMQFRDAAGDGDKVVQAVAGLTNGVSYTVGGTISGRTAGVISVLLGGTNLGTVNANGTFSLTGIAGAGGSIEFRASASSAVMDLDDVTCVPA